jgi:hypothetical protein
MNWLERARREIPKSARRRTANSAERTLTAVMAVPHPGLWEKSAASIGSNGSTPSGDFSEIEATIHRLCDARSDDDGNRAALLSDLREYLRERWPCLIGNFNVEVAKYEATSGAVDPPARRAGQALAAPGGLRSGSLTAPDCLRKLRQADSVRRGQARASLKLARAL